MRYTEEIIINLPRERVIELFDSFENLKQWQEGLVEIEHLSGEPGKPGAQTRLLYDMGKRKLEMIETITSRNMPDEFSGAYDAKDVHNIVRNTFYPQDETTRWLMDCEFQFRGFMRIMSFFMGQRTFRKQTRKGMESFKRFAEGAGS